MERVLRRLRTARPRDIPEGLLILGVAARVERSLRRDRLPETARIAGVTLANDPHPDDEAGSGAIAAALPSWALRRAYLVSLVMRRWPFGDTCLRRALVTGHRLSAMSPALVIGVRSLADDGPLAHAWLRIDGVDMDPLSRQFLELTIPD